MVSTTQKLLAVAAHISYLFLGVGFIFVPLLLFLLQKNREPFTAEHAKQALCVQFVIGILGAVVTVLSMVFVGVLLWPVLFVLAFIWFVCSLIACWRALEGRPYCYPGMAILTDRLN